MSHLACFVDSQNRQRRMKLPDAPYGPGHTVQADDGAFYRIVGTPHHEPQGTGHDVLWPVEVISAEDVPSLLTRKRG